jgi:hypothetical protein
MRALKNIDVAFIPMNPRGWDPKVFAAALQGSSIDVRIRDWYEP